MNPFFQQFISIKFIFMSFVSILLTTSIISCAVSSSPSVTEIVTTAQPLVSGQSNVSLTSSSSTFNVSGTCDTKSYGTEYSVNGGTSWVDLGSCSTGSFSFNVIVVSTTSVQIRSKTKFAYTGTTVVNIRLLLPPTGTLLSFVTASSSATTNLSSPTLSFTMSPFLTGQRASPVMHNFNLDLHTTGIVYAP